MSAKCSHTLATNSVPFWPTPLSSTRSYDSSSLPPAIDSAQFPILMWTDRPTDQPKPMGLCSLCLIVLKHNALASKGLPQRLLHQACLPKARPATCRDHHPNSGQQNKPAGSQEQVHSNGLYRGGQTQVFGIEACLTFCSW